MIYGKANGTQQNGEWVQATDKAWSIPQSSQGQPFLADDSVMLPAKAFPGGANGIP
jgi:hypothetical protein